MPAETAGWPLDAVPSDAEMPTDDPAPTDADTVGVLDPVDVVETAGGTATGTEMEGEVTATPTSTLVGDTPAFGVATVGAAAVPPSEATPGTAGPIGAGPSALADRRPTLMTARPTAKSTYRPARARLSRLAMAAYLSSLSGQ